MGRCVVIRASRRNISDGPVMGLPGIGSNKGEFACPDLTFSFLTAERNGPRPGISPNPSRAEGFSVWWDAVLRSGETFDEVIERELRAAKAVVVLWSPRSVASRWVRAEATLADRANKLVPVIIEPCNLPIIFELTHAADLADGRRHVRPPLAVAGSATCAAWSGRPKRWRPWRSRGRKPAASRLPRTPELEAHRLSRHRPAADAGEADKAAQAADEVELCKALERLGKPRESGLQKPTPAEEEQDRILQASPTNFARKKATRSIASAGSHALDAETLSRCQCRPASKIGRTAPADIIVSGSRRFSGPLPGRTGRRQAARHGPQFDQRHLYRQQADRTRRNPWRSARFSASAMSRSSMKSARRSELRAAGRPTGVNRKTAHARESRIAAFILSRHCRDLLACDDCLCRKTI